MNYILKANHGKKIAVIENGARTKEKPLPLKLGITFV